MTVVQGVSRRRTAGAGQRRARLLAPTTVLVGAVLGFLVPAVVAAAEEPGPGHAGASVAVAGERATPTTDERPQVPLLASHGEAPDTVSIRAEAAPVDDAGGNAPTGRSELANALWTAAAVVLASLAVAAIVVIGRRRRGRWRAIQAVEEVERGVGLPVIAAPPTGPGDQLLTSDAESIVAYDTLARALRDAPRWWLGMRVGVGQDVDAVSVAASELPALGPSPGVVLVTATASGEGTSTTVANLALAHAEAGLDVIIVDCAFAAPVQQLFLDDQASAGLRDQPDLDDPVSLIRTSVVDGVAVLPAGTAGPVPSGLVRRADRLVDQVRELADVILVDAGPVLHSPATAALVGAADGVVLVARSGRTSEQAVRAAVEELARLRAAVAGVVLVGGTRGSARRSAGADPWRVTMAHGSDAPGREDAGGRVHDGRRADDGGRADDGPRAGVDVEDEAPLPGGTTPSGSVATARREPGERSSSRAHDERDSGPSAERAPETPPTTAASEPEYVEPVVASSWRRLVADDAVVDTPEGVVRVVHPSTSPTGNGAPGGGRGVDPEEDQESDREDTSEERPERWDDLALAVALTTLARDDTSEEPPELGDDREDTSVGRPELGDDPGARPQQEDAPTEAERLAALPPPSWSRDLRPRR